MRLHVLSVRGFNALRQNTSISDHDCCTICSNHFTMISTTSLIAHVLIIVRALQITNVKRNVAHTLWSTIAQTELMYHILCLIGSAVCTLFRMIFSIVTMAGP